MSAAGIKRGSCAIVGVAESDLGEVAPGLSAMDLAAQATHRALADSGIDLSEVDGLFGAATQSRMFTLALGEYLGIQPRYMDSSYTGGSSFMSHVAHAVAAIEVGLCNVAVVAYGSTLRTAGRSGNVTREHNPWEAPYKPFLPSSGYALAAARHMHLYGTQREHLAEVAVAARQWAQLNPLAWSRGDLTAEQVLASPMVSYPLTVRDCCLVTDGGAALVLTSAKRAAHLAKPPVYVLGCGDAQTHQSISQMPDLTVTAAKQSGEAAYRMAGVRPSDVDVRGLYDAFTINPILFLEDLGFCPKGEGGAFVSDGKLRPGGSLPTNTNGGGLSYTHPGMYGLFLLVEAARQLRGECGPRQVAGCEVALAHGNGGVLASQSTVILGSSATV